MPVLLSVAHGDPELEALVRRRLDLALTHLPSTESWSVIVYQGRRGGWDIYVKGPTGAARAHVEGLDDDRLVPKFMRLLLKTSRRRTSGRKVG